ncbi:MAG: 4-hydroxybenzoate octaprenyltransferase [Planctomycetota bacterium]|nr:MAG: 4-hydroxybenzoate octaprenyltransferase [Planctomycetota bacterium]
MSKSLATVLRMIKFEHSLFALPFALSGAWLAAEGWPPWRDLVGIVIAAVCARSAAMAFNRLVDRGYDATNPRTRNRELVRGLLSPTWTTGFIAVNAALFIAASFWLAPICGWLSFPVLALLLGYSYLKRFSYLCHLGLGLALACAPAGAWLAVRKQFDEDWPLPVWIGGGVLLWVAGFDLLYALQDRDHDRREGLHSIPSRFGPLWTRRLALLFHAGTLLLFARFGSLADLGPGFYFGLTVVAALLVWEHWLVRGGRDQAIPVAFFQVNAWVGVAFFLGLAGDLHGVLG